jgi:formamidopyrimidine-DNA glycosylase
MLRAMPELPEVETTRRGLAPHVAGRTITRVEVRDARLRWPVASDLARSLADQRVESLTRRGKYLLFATGAGTLLVHLGMSGSLRYLPTPAAPGVHDHVDVCFADGGTLRFNDPRRFGCFILTPTPAAHPLLAELGPEPLGGEFTADYLWRASRGRRVAIKQHLMNGHVVVGVGNIYANEALFRAGIRPTRPAGRIARERFEPLVAAVRAVLRDAIEEGGTTLRNFVGGDGKPGYFRGSLRVYERNGEACGECATPIERRVLGQRATYFCPRCQR